MKTNLETMAAELATATGCTIEQARAGLRVDVSRKYRVTARTDENHVWRWCLLSR